MSTNTSRSCLTFLEFSESLGKELQMLEGSCRLYNLKFTGCSCEKEGEISLTEHYGHFISFIDL